MKWKPYKYQKRMVDYLIDNPQFGLFADLGLGKTVTVLTAFDILKYDHLKISTMLVVAPLRVIKTVWPEEIQKWDHLRHLRIATLHGPYKRMILQQRADIYTINYEGLNWLMNELRNRNTFAKPIDMIVFDESTFIKNVSAQRSKVARTLSKVIDRRVIMTGTPTPNNIGDIWHQIFILDHGNRLKETQYAFRLDHFTQGGYSGYEWRLKRGHQKEIEDKIRDITITLASEDYLDLPEVIYNTVKTEMNKAQWEDYKKLEREFFLEIEGAEIEVFNTASLSIKLRQFVQGFLYNEDGAHDIHDLKTKALREIRDNSSGNILVGIQFKHEADMIRKEFGPVPVINSSTKHADTIRYIKDWNAGRIPMMVGHPASMGHGLNLQSGGHTLVWFGLGFNLEHYLQMNKRIHRPGQEHKVIIHHIIMKGTIDEAVMGALKRKAGSMNELLKALKEWKHGTRSKDRIVPEKAMHKTRMAV